MPSIRRKKRSANAAVKLSKQEVEETLERESQLPDCQKTLFTGEAVHESYPEILKLCKIKLDSLGNSTLELSNYAQCSRCSELLAWNGGNVKRHSQASCSKIIVPRNITDPSQRSITDFVPQNLTTEQLGKITQLMVEYCLATGRSFNHMADNDFQKLIVGTLAVASKQRLHETVLDQLPDRKKIAGLCESKAEKLIADMYAKLRPLFEQEKVTVAVDFGRQNGVDYLAVCTSYLDDSWHLKVVPVGFLPCLAESKTHEEVYQLLENMGLDAGIQPNVLRKAYICADGAANLEKCAVENFKGYIKCSNHGIHKFAERTIVPYNSDLAEYTQTELDALANLNTLLAECRKLSLLVKATKKVRSKLKALPNSGAPTRWLSFLLCVEDILQIIHILVEHEETKESAALILSNQKKLKSLLFVLGRLQQWNILFQTEDVTIHLVAPLYRQLLCEFEAQRDGLMIPSNQSSFDLTLVQTISKSACFALRRQYEKLHDVHFAAALLNPSTKKMKSFEQWEFVKAKQFVEDLLRPSVVAPRRPPSRDEPNASMCVQASRALADDDSEDDTECELSCYMKDSIDKMEPLATYWTRKKNTWPLLYDVATRIFGIIPSEAACERAFSKSGRILDKLRTSLDPERVNWIVTSALLHKAKF